MYANGKMIPVENIPGMGAGEIRENNGVGKFKYDILEELFKLPQCTPERQLKIFLKLGKP
jgi:hypothetical protein